MPLQIYIPNTGQGDCTFIKFPNGKNMLIDMNKTSVDVDIIEFLNDMIKKKKHVDIDKTCRRINYFVNTHPHEDHLRGIGELNSDDFYIDEIWDSGHRLYIPAEKKEEYKHYYAYLDLIKKLKRRSSNSVRKLKAGSSPTEIGSTKIFTFNPSKYYSESNIRTEIHNQCGVLKIQYKNNAVMFAGDTDRDSWENRIVPNYSDEKEVNGIKQKNLLESTVLHASHHGSKHFFVKNDETDKYKLHMDKINPRFTVISVGKSNNFGHPHQLAVDIYKEKTNYNRVYQTKDINSIYFAFHGNNDVEYKKGLSYDQLVSMKPSKNKEENSAVFSSLITLRATVGEDIELNFPAIIPKTEREGYF